MKPRGLGDHIDLYEEYGFSLIPLQEKAKEPLRGFSLRTYFERASTKEERESWWPEVMVYNIGVVTGAVSELVVLDFDDMDAYVAAAEAMPELETTVRVATSRGMHVYFRPEEPAGRTFTLRFRDQPGKHHVKSDGGFVVAPPSIHPSGDRYELVNHYPLLRLHPVAVVEALVGAGFERAQPEAHDRPENWYEELFDRTVPDGERNDTAASLMGLLRHYIPFRPGLSRGLLHCWSQVYCDPPLSEREVDNLTQSFYRYES